MRNASHPHFSVVESRGVGEQGYDVVREDEKARKGSLRNAVRRIFGRRSKEVEPPPALRASPMRHGHHKSEPPVLAPTKIPEERYQQEEHIPHRTLSAPLHAMPAASFERNRSPYAVEFPHSARLKPLALENPFTAPGSQLRRRKTLPSILIPENDASQIAASVNDAPEPPPVPSLEANRDISTPDPRPVVGSIRSVKRKSRSAGDLKGAACVEQSTSMQKSEELRFWRESFQGNVLQASGFTNVMPSREEEVEDYVDDRTPTPTPTEPLSTRQSGATTIGSTLPSTQHGLSFSGGDMGSVGTEMSRDLEDRVARLEDGLQHFRRSLQRLTNDRNRRTVVMGQGRTPSSVAGARTPSMLADTLLDFSPSDYPYNFNENTQRPSTSPHRPQTPVRPTDSASAGRLAMPPLPRTMSADEPFITPSPPVMTSLLPPGMGPASNASNSSPAAPAPQTQQYTFKSLYEMLSDERSARRRLESQLRNMRQEINNLHYQVSAGSHAADSHRSSFAPPLDPHTASTRLGDLLRATDASPPGVATASSREYRDSSGTTGLSSFPFTAGRPGVVSRFSASESEAGAGGPGTDEVDLETPYEAYQTPREERSRYPLRSDEGDMF